MSDITSIELTIGIAFGNKNLLLQALTHSTYVRYVGNPKNHNEGLALLGDTLLELVVVDYLYRVSADTWKKDVISQKRDELEARSPTSRICRSDRACKFDSSQE